MANISQRYKASLQNLAAGDDWPGICNTTPAIINGISHPKPTYCYDKVRVLVNVTSSKLNLCTLGSLAWNVGCMGN